MIPTFLSPSIRSSSSVTPARTSSTQHARSKRRYQKLQLWAGRSGTRASGLGRGNEKPTARHHTHIIRESGQRGMCCGCSNSVRLGHQRRIPFAAGQQPYAGREHGPCTAPSSREQPESADGRGARATLPASHTAPRPPAERASKPPSLLFLPPLR